MADDPDLLPTPDYRRVTTRQMWALGGLTPYECGRRAVAGYREHKLDHRAVYFAFYALYSLAPVLIVAVSTVVLSLDPRVAENVLADLESTLAESLPGDASDFIITEMNREAQSLRENTNWTIVAVGWVFTVYSGRVMLLTVTSGLDAAYGVEPEFRRKFLRRNLVAVGLIVAATFGLLIASVVLQFAAESILERVSPTGNFGWAASPSVMVAKWVFAVAFLLAGVSLIYAFVPSAKLRWSPLTPGGALFALAFLIATQGFRYYIREIGGYGDTYGALAGVVVLMTWLWLTGTLLLFGGQLNSVIHRHALRELFMKDRRKNRPKSDLPAIGGLSDPVEAEVEEEIARDEAEAEAEERATRDRRRRVADELAEPPDPPPPAETQPDPAAALTPAAAPRPVAGPVAGSGV